MSIGGGKDSTAMALMASEGDFGRVPDVGIFADVGWEPAYVYEHLDWLETRLSFPIHRVSRGRNLRDDVYNGENAYGHKYIAIPVRTVKPDGSLALGKRECTRNYKIEPIQRHIRDLLGYSPRQRVREHVEQWIGISASEIIRAKDSRHRWITNRYPLIEAGMTRSDCERYFKRRFPDRELRKSSCIGCPYRSRAQWLEVADHDPTGLADAIKVDERMRSPEFLATRKDPAVRLYLHSDGVPLADAIRKAQTARAEGAQGTLFDDDLFAEECEGVCGV